MNFSKIRINRNILECKVLSVIRSKKHQTVLIETYWNVKGIECTGITLVVRCINRNILECKEVTSK